MDNHKSFFFFCLLAFGTFLGADASFQSFVGKKIQYSPATCQFPSSSTLTSTLAASSDASNYESMIYNTLMRLELKREILECADQFKILQTEMFRMRERDEEAIRNAKKNIRKRRNIIKRIFTRVSQEELQREIDSDETYISNNKKLKVLFGASSFSVAKVALGDKGEEIIELAERLSTLNPTAVPTLGFEGYKGGKECLLDGKWKLRFTTAADATFVESPTRGFATTSQEVNATSGTITNVVDFERGTVEGFRVQVEGSALSDDEIGLRFSKIVVNRRKNFLRQITIPLPSFRFLRAFATLGPGGKAKTNKRAYFKVRYIDDDGFRMHKSGDGNWFIQTRIKGT